MRGHWNRLRVNMQGRIGWATKVGGPLLALVVGVGGLSASLYSTAPCACININRTIAGEMNAVDEFVQRHIRENGGAPPTFREVESMYLQQKAVGRFDSGGRIRNDLDVDARKPKFNPGEGDQHTLLYALAPDGRSYALAGIGLMEVRRTVFGVPLWQVRNAFPVLRPGEPLPRESSV